MALDDAQEAAIKKQLADAEADAEKWKGLSRKHETESKSNFDELEKLKASQLSDADKKAAADKAAADKLTKFEQELADERLARMRAEVAADKGLKPGQAKRLTGATKEELEADADDILENFKSADTDDDPDKGKQRPATRPTTSVSGGSDPAKNNEVVETDPAKLAADVPRF